LRPPNCVATLPSDVILIYILFFYACFIFDAKLLSDGFSNKVNTSFKLVNFMDLSRKDEKKELNLVLKLVNLQKK
jgi:lipoprotein